jgi:hypothetical protein
MEADFDLNSNDVLNGGDIYTGRLFLNGELVTTTNLATGGALLIANNLSDLSDVNAAIANLGLTASLTELNYLDGAISNIQTQINNILTGYLPLTGGDLTGDVTSKAGKSHIFKSPDGTKTGTIFQTNGDALNITATKVTVNSDPILDFVYVGDYGAVGDGVTDDTAAINTAIATGKSVVFGQKTYAISATLTASDADQVLWGYGATLLKTAACDAITLSGLRAKVLGFHIKGQNFSLAGVNVTSPTGALVRDVYSVDNQDGFVVTGPGTVPGVDFCTFDTCFAYSNTNSGFYLFNMTDGSLVNCISQTNGAYGYLLEDQCFSMKVINCVGDDNGITLATAAAFRAEKADSLRIVSSTFTNQNNGGHGIHLIPDVAGQTGFSIVACGAAQNEGFGINIDVNGAFNTNKVHVSECRINGNTAGSVSIAVGSNKCTLSNNEFNGVAPVDAGTDTLINGCDAGNNRQGWELLETKTASGSATIDMTAFDATNYSDYMVVIRNAIPATDNVGFRCRTSTDGGATFDSGASDYADNIGVMLFTAASKTYAGSEAVDTIRLNNTVAIGSDVGEEGWSGEVTIFEPGAATKTRLEFAGTYTGSAGVHVRSDGRGVRQSAADVDAIQFYQTSGNIESGDFTLYGRRKT